MNWWWIICFLVCVFYFAVFEEWREKGLPGNMPFRFFCRRYTVMSMYNYILRMLSPVPLLPFPAIAKPLFPALEHNYKEIHAELLNYLQTHPATPAAKFSPMFFGRIGDNGSQWQVVTLKWYSKEFPETQICFPKTMQWLRASGPRILLAMFSIMEPGTHVPLHCGPFSGCLRYHLPLEVPPDPESCYINVADQRHIWRAGQPVVFDDTFCHEVYNNSKSRRIVLFLDVERDISSALLQKANHFICRSRLVEWLSQLNSRHEKSATNKEGKRGHK